MKRNEALCDIHRTTAMTPVRIELLSPFEGRNLIDAVRCRMDTCGRHYSPEFGYFSGSLERNPDFGNTNEKPQCSHHDPVAFMYLEHVGWRSWQYSCPVEGCDSHLPCPKSEL